MRILHTSDWHLGIQLCGVSLLEEQRRMVECLVRTVGEQKVDAVVIAGDVFDHAVARPEAIALYTDAMTSLCRDCGVPVLLCAGNHDGAARLAACGALLRESGLYIAGSLSAGLEPVVLGDAAFFLLPWFSADQVRYLYPDARARTLSEAMAAVCERMQSRFPAGGKNVLVAHCFVGGAQVSESDRAAVVGGASQVAADAFAGFDYVALGHLHRAQNPGPNLRYSGSPLKYSFAEAGHKKSFTLLDTETMEVSELPVKAGRDLRVLSGPFEELMEGWDASGDYLKIELTDVSAGMEKLELLRERYPNLLLLTGKPLPALGRADSLTVEELTTLSPRDLVTRFCLEVAGEEPDEEQLGWFDEAAREDGEVAQ